MRSTQHVICPGRACGRELVADYNAEPPVVRALKNDSGDAGSNLVFSKLEAGRYQCGDFLIEKSHTPGVGWELFNGPKYLCGKKTLRAAIAAASEHVKKQKPE